MRLINAATLQLETFVDARHAPPYAILSHTWGSDSDEVSFQEMAVPDVRVSHTARKLGFRKIEKTCEVALRDYQLQYAWVDTCCIDKSSSAELSEAINSMFKWYQESRVCFAFLEDWDGDYESLGRCRWWTRGWTLQELIAPSSIAFYSQDWGFRGDKSRLCDTISDISRIHRDVLSQEELLSNVPVAVRMSWASRRSTTREEDIAYSLMGIFDVNMPLLYGEGKKAFQRLQEEIIKSTPDMSLFAWTTNDDCKQEFTGILASSPAEFKNAQNLLPSASHVSSGDEVELSITSHGVRCNLIQGPDPRTGYYSMPLLHYACRWQPKSLKSWVPEEFNEHYVLDLLRVGKYRLVRARAGVLRPSSASELAVKFTSATWHIPQAVTQDESQACCRRRLHVTNVFTTCKQNFMLASIEPADVWDRESMKSGVFRFIDATSNSKLRGFLSYEPTNPGTYPTFLVLYCFQNPRGLVMSHGYWQCDLMTKDMFESRSTPGWQNSRWRLLMSLSGQDLWNSRSIDLKPFVNGLPTKTVTLTFRRHQSSPDWGEKFSIALSVKDIPRCDG